jgi:hypothetical protein
MVFTLAAPTGPRGCFSVRPVTPRQRFSATCTSCSASTAVDLTSGGLDEAMRGRDEFNFTVDIQFGEATIEKVRTRLVELSREQYERNSPR